jgi:hypothetical protein
MHWKWWLFVPPVITVMVYITYDAFGLWLSLGFFSLVIPAAFYLYRQDSRGLTAIMKPLATQYSGTLGAATLMNFPQLHFEAEGRRYSVQAMPTAGPTSLPGPFTFVQLILPFDSACQCEVRRTPALVRGVVATLAPERQATTADPAFDKAFRLAGSDQAIMADLLNSDLRALLMASQLAALRLRLAGNEIYVFIDGLPKTSAEIEEMINLACALADRLVTPMSAFVE